MFVEFPFNVSLDNISLGKANVITQGNDITIIGWGAQTTTNVLAADHLKSSNGLSVEVIDLTTLSPIDLDTILESVKKTRRVIVAHEAPMTSGLGAELVSLIQQHALLHLKAPIIRCCGYDTPFPLAFEQYYLPGISRIKLAALKTMEF